jgi:hypothetical protein
MTSCVNQQMGACEKKQIIGCGSPAHQDSPIDTSFDAEFSLPLGFFEIDFLNNYGVSESHQNKLQIEDDRFYHQV